LIVLEEIDLETHGNLLLDSNLLRARLNSSPVLKYDCDQFCVDNRRELVLQPDTSDLRPYARGSGMLGACNG